MHSAYSINYIVLLQAMGRHGRKRRVVVRSCARVVVRSCTRCSRAVVRRQDLGESARRRRML